MRSGNFRRVLNKRQLVAYEQFDPGSLRLIRPSSSGPDPGDDPGPPEPCSVLSRLVWVVTVALQPPVRDGNGKCWCVEDTSEPLARLSMMLLCRGYPRTTC
jgi:hypothetical protein